MLKKNKGFTLYELLISFVFLVFIGYSFFNIIFDVKEKQSLTLIESEAKAFQTEIMLSIRSDFTNNIIYGITQCAPDATCLTFDYGSGITKELEADLINNSINYDNRSYYLPTGSDFGDAFSVTKTFVAGVGLAKSDSVLHISLPVEFYDLEKIYGLDVIYQYDSTYFTFTDFDISLIVTP